jgi:hypothetical protein
MSFPNAFVGNPEEEQNGFPLKTCGIDMPRGHNELKMIRKRILCFGIVKLPVCGVLIMPEATDPG